MKFNKAKCEVLNLGQGNGFKPKEGGFRPNLWKKCTVMRLVRHWNGLPKDVVGAPSLEVLKVSLDRAWSNLS